MYICPRKRENLYSQEASSYFLQHWKHNLLFLDRESTNTPLLRNLQRKNSLIHDTLLLRITVSDGILHFNIRRLRRKLSYKVFTRPGTPQHTPSSFNYKVRRVLAGHPTTTLFGSGGIVSSKFPYRRCGDGNVLLIGCQEYFHSFFVCVWGGRGELAWIISIRRAKSVCLCHPAGRASRHTGYPNFYAGRIGYCPS